MKERNYAVDILKGLGILLVVYGHAGHDRIPAMVFDYVYSFHMPLFFFATGLLSWGRMDAPFGKYAARKVKSLLLPYVCFFAIGLLMYEVKSGFAYAPDMTWLRAFLFGGKYCAEIPVIWPLWFLHTLFFATIIFWFIAKLNRLAVCAVMLAMFPLYVQAGGVPTLPNIIQALTYICFGYLIAENVDKVPNKYTCWAFIALGIALVVKCNYLVKMNYPMMAAAAMISVLGWYGLCRLVSRNAVTEYLGRNSLYILGLHGIMWMGANFAARKIGAPPMAAAVIAALINTALCCAACEVYKRAKFKITGR